ncbi:MAG TPA: hypothetical protein VII23_17245 [Terriglobales bacterium]
MRNSYRPMGWFFCLLMMMAVATVGMPQTSGPALTQVVEGLFGHQTGAVKKNAALTLVQTAISATDAIAGKDVVDAGKFQDGLSKVIDGVVQCLNASAWSKAKSA